jgi:hypothetical protein
VGEENGFHLLAGGQLVTGNGVEDLEAVVVHGITRGASVEGRESDHKKAGQEGQGRREGGCTSRRGAKSAH